MFTMVKRLLLFILLILANTHTFGQVAPPEAAIYNVSDTYRLFTSPPPEKAETIQQMVARGAMHYYNYICLTSADSPEHSANNAIDASFNITHVRADPAFVPGTTYWINDYLHVGHVHYDIGLIAAAQAVPLDRIIMQRAACHGTLCAGIGTVDSFYKGYFAAVLIAAGNLDVPVYTRFDHNRKVAPFKFSTDPKTDFYNTTAMDGAWSKTMLLHRRMYFERLMRRTNLHYGAVGAVSAEAVQRFKAAAYGLIPCTPPLTTYFEKEGPFKILFAYRGNKASRQIENMDEFVGRLRTKFPSPTYQLRLFNTSDPYLTFATQLQAVAESHVVIANHGAFEGNMIYMRNSSLLVELFGHYGNNEIHTFQRLAVMFGLYYARLHSESLTDHQAPFFNMSRTDIANVENTVQEYFDRKPYLLNLKPVRED